MKVRELVKSLVKGRGDPMRLCYAIFRAAWNHGGWVGQPGEQMSAKASCPELAIPGAEFLQLAEALERHQDNVEASMAYLELIKDAAGAFFSGRRCLSGKTLASRCRTGHDASRSGRPGTSPVCRSDARLSLQRLV